MEKDCAYRWVSYLPEGSQWKLGYRCRCFKTKSSYADGKVKANTKYVYTVRPYKKGGGVKYMAPMTLSNQVTTPEAVEESGNSQVSTSEFTAAERDVMKKILYAVETGGQVYGQQDYADFTEAHTNSSIENAITIGAGQWYATEAQRLLKVIHQKMGDAEWKKYDTSNKLWKDVCNKDWSKYEETKYKNIIVKSSVQRLELNVRISSCMNRLQNMKKKSVILE